MTSAGLRAHPAAEAWPMLNDDEMRGLADDIKANGLRHPITLDAGGLILDGKQRYEACRLANVEPDFVTYDGDDPVGFVLSMNALRQNLTPNQRVMRDARWLRMSEHEPDELAPGVADALMVLNYAPDLADQVSSGAVTVRTAFDEAKKRKDEAEHLGRIRGLLAKAGPDLIGQINDGTLTVFEAVAVLNRQVDDAEAQRRRTVKVVRELVGKPLSLVINGFDTDAVRDAAIARGHTAEQVEHVSEIVAELAQAMKAV